MRSIVLLALLALPLSAHAQRAAPCDSSAVLLKATPIYGVGTITIGNACPAFAAALWRDYLARGDTSRYGEYLRLAGATGAPPRPAPTPAPVPAPTPTPTPTPVPPPPPSGSGVLYYDDFTRYTSTADLNARFWLGPSRDNGGVSGVGQPIVYDTAERAMRYDWPARPTAACSGQEMTIALMPRLNPPPPLTNLWVKFTSKESLPFSHGQPGCGGRSYKFFLVGFESATTRGRIGTYLFDGIGPKPEQAARLYLDMNDTRGSAIATPSALPIGGEPTWGGSYHTWVLELLGIGTSSATFTVYLDGTKVGALTSAFLAGQTVGPGWNVQFQLGANINNGPPHAQSRWFREFGVYTTKPAGIP
jgi:hypothetical protein